MTRADEILVNVPKEDRWALETAAQLAVNMTGERFSDALRSELRDYQNGRDDYMAREQWAHDIIRNLGY